MLPAAFLTATGTVADLASYGLGGLIFVTMVIPLALYVLRDKDKQLRAKDEEITRLRSENAAMRQAADEKTQPLLQQVASVLAEAIRALDRTRT